MDEHETRTDEDIERLAGELHERVRALNHLTQDPGLSEMAAAYTVLGNLAQTSFRLGQTAEQIDAFLTRELDAGRLGHDRGDDPAPAVTAAHDALGRVIEQSADLGESFRRAAGAVAPIHALDADDESPSEQQVAANMAEGEDAQTGNASEDFPRAIGEVLQSPDPVADVPPELRSPLQPPHPRRGR